MAERIANRYQRLYEIRLLHHYWLDEGGTVFDLLADQAKKDARLLHYDVRPFLTVTPTDATMEALNGLDGLYKDTALGGLVAVPEGAVVAHDATFEFVVTVRQADVFNIRIKNRSTVWQYLDKRTGAVDDTEPDPLPLTHFGNAGTKQKPASSPVKAVISGNRITQLVSEVFV